MLLVNVLQRVQRVRRVKTVIFKVAYKLCDILRIKSDRHTRPAPERLTDYRQVCLLNQDIFKVSFKRHKIITMSDQGHS